MDAAAAREVPPRHILILTDRDWTHPQGGGTGTNLYGQVARWVAWGHRVTVIAGEYEGCAKVEQLGPLLTIHRMGTRLTVFPRAAWAVLRGVGRDADVVLEVINGIAFFTPLWLRKPRVALVHHVHREMYVAEHGRRGALVATVLETLPLRFLYSGTPFLTISHAARSDMVDMGIAGEDIHVAYLGVEPEQFHRGERASEPTLLYLGRLKQYKRIENVLDVVEAIPAARLEIAGEGDHREVLEAEIERRGIDDRVRMHGFVSEDSKPQLYARAWLSLTASSAEGWCLTVMEAAACATPSAALRVGGLTESIVDGETGILADDVPELVARVQEVVEKPALLERLGAAAEARARSFTWENAAATNLNVMESTREAAASRGGASVLRHSLARSETAKAVGLAGATLFANGIALLFTVVFARLLGASGYGSLAALISTFLILSVPGLALQVATAREAALGRLGSGPDLSATHARWMEQLGVALVVFTVAGILGREWLAAAIGVEQEWAAAATAPTAVLWLALSIERGILQGARAYKAAGLSVILEAGGRLILGLALFAGGAGVTGAYLGTPLSMLAAAAILAVVIRRRLGSPEGGRISEHLRDLVRGAWAPVLGLTLIAVLQNLDVIVVKHRVDGDGAGAYAAAAVAAKLVIWVGIGIAYYLVPEAARRAAAGLNPRPVLLRGLLVVGMVALPMLVLYAAVPGLVLKLGFDIEFAEARRALVVLGAAMTLLAIVSLAVQYMLAIEQLEFLWVLGVVAIAEPFLLSAGGTNLLTVATLIFGLQCVAASGVLALSWRAGARRREAVAV